MVDKMMDGKRPNKAKKNRDAETVTADNDQKRSARAKENNPFSEQEKHGPDAHRRSPGEAQEYQGNPSVQRQSPGVENDNEANTDNDNVGDSGTGGKSETPDSI